MITLEQIYPSDANAERLSRMIRRFGLEYDLPTRSIQLNQRQRRQQALSDIQQGYSLWILLEGERIGFVGAPFITDADGNRDGRYLDTRWIQPQHRQKGYGTQVIDQLEQDHGLVANKINSERLQSHGQWWHGRGYDHGVPCFYVDGNMAYEKQLFLSGNKNIHWFLFHKEKEITARYRQQGRMVLFENEQPEQVEA